MQTIYLDISNKGVIPTIYAKQGDVGRKFRIVFTNAGLPYNLENCLFSAWYQGDSGEGNYTQIGEESAFVVNRNSVEVELITQMLAVQGVGELCLVLSDELSEIGSWNIPYVCDEKPGANSEGATEYYTAFSELIDAARKFSVDKTLTRSGSPADAAETGRQISVERSRIDNLAKMHGDANTTTFSITDDHFTGSFRTNGTGARIYLSISNLTLAGNGEYISEEYLLPVNFAPLGNVELKSNNPNIEGTFVLGEVSNDGCLVTIKLVNNSSDEVYISSAVADAYYPTAGLFIDELADLRVDYDGDTHPTAGGAVRKQINDLHSRIDDIEQAGGGGGGTAEGANALIVTVTDNVASHTPAEMLQHINNGGSITARVAEDGGNGTTVYRSICPITITVEEAHFFETWDEDVIYKWDVQQDRSVTGHEMDNAFYSPTVHKLQNDVGDIETALDSILAIQNELIGGDA